MQYLFIHYTFIYIVNHVTEMVSVRGRGCSGAGECLPTVCEAPGKSHST